MPPLAATPDSAEARPLPLRMRPDLIVAPQRVAGRRMWAVKDPLAMSYFRLRDEEYAVLEMLDGIASAAEIIARFERRFAPRRLEPAGLQGFLARLHADGLVLSDSPGQGHQLHKRSADMRRRRTVSNISNLLAIRFPGVNPAPLLDRLETVARIVFSPAAIAASLALVIAALVLITARFSEFAARLPTMQGYFTPRNALLALVAISATKVLHELAHALACRRLGGECHEIGPMLLVFAPCLYCNVSDSWMFPSKWQRIAVAAAGIYVEIVLAAAAALVWWGLEPGLPAALCLNIMLVCSVGTLVFNANPLLRYDAYYILSDLVEIPNLAEQSSEALRAFAARLLLGVKRHDARGLSGWRHAFLFVYGIASAVYRLVLVAVLLWFCYRLLVPYRLEALVSFLALSVLGGLFARPALRLARFARTPTPGTKVPRFRAFIALVLLLSLAGAAAVVPLPVNVTAPVVIEPHDARSVYVTEPGVLVSGVENGTRVEEGDVIARLSSPELDFDILQLVGERDRQRQHLAGLERRRGQDRAAAAEIPTAREGLADLDERLRRREADRERLVIKAPVAGTVIPADAKHIAPPSGELAAWGGTPLDERNRGAFLETGTLVCRIGDPRAAEAVATVDQADVERLGIGLEADVKLDQAAGAILPAKVVEIAELDVDVAPRPLVEAGELPVQADEAGMVRPLTAAYQVRLALAPHDQPLIIGAAGRAKIYAPPESIVDRLVRWARGTFHFVR